jgi:hypothetical protein
MHIEGVSYDKKILKPLYGRLAPSAKRKEVVLVEAYGVKTRYNILIRHFRENIAPSVGNMDAICGGLVNLLAYSHEVFVSGKEVEVEPIDVMDCIYKEMSDTVITKKKTPVYAPYVMYSLLLNTPSILSSPPTSPPTSMSNLKGKPLRVLWKKSLPLVMKRKKRMRKKNPLKLHLGRGLA